MHACMHTYIHVHTRMHSYIHTHTYIHIYIHYIHTLYTYIHYIHTYIIYIHTLYTYTHAHIHILHTYMHAFIHTCIYTYMHTNIYTYIHYVHTYIHAYIHYIHTYIHTTKHFFPINKDRLSIKIELTPNFTAIVTAHGKTKAYLRRFKIIQSPECPCDGGNQTVDHLLYNCTKLQTEKVKLISNISNHDKWPVNKRDRVNEHIKHLNQFANSIHFEKL